MYFCSLSCVKFRALYGKSICNYQLVLLTDPRLQNTQSVGMCLKILAFLRLITQVVLPREPLCWLVYNGEFPSPWTIPKESLTLQQKIPIRPYKNYLRDSSR